MLFDSIRLVIGGRLAAWLCTARPAVRAGH
jgi:hypothetical protein